MNCKNCNSSLKFIPNYLHESVETNEEVTNDVNLCNSCGALHYVEDGYNVFEYTPKILELNKTIKGFATDYDIAVDKMREKKKYAEEI